MPDNYSFRSVIIEDLPVIREIYSHAVINHQTAHTEVPGADYWEKWLVSHAARYPAVIILEGENVAGFASFSPYREGRQAFANVAEISYYIHPANQRRGAGTTLINRLLVMAISLKFKHLVAILLQTNTASVRLWKNLALKNGEKCPVLQNLMEIQPVICTMESICINNFSESFYALYLKIIKQK